MTKSLRGLVVYLLAQHNGPIRASHWPCHHDSPTIMLIKSSYRHCNTAWCSTFRAVLTMMGRCFDRMQIYFIQYLVQKFGTTCIFSHMINEIQRHGVSYGGLIKLLEYKIFVLDFWSDFPLQSNIIVWVRRSNGVSSAFSDRQTLQTSSRKSLK